MATVLLLLVVLAGAAVPSALAKPGDYMYVCQIGVDDQAGADDAHLSSPHGVAVDRAGNVFIADQGNARILKFQRISDREYSLMAKWGGVGEGPGQFHAVSGVALDTGGNVYVSDWGNYRVQKFAPSADGRTYSFVTEWGNSTALNDPGALYLPTDVAVAADGTVWVAEQSGTLKRFTSNGAYLEERDALPWTLGFGSGTPESLACDTQGNLWVTDTQHSTAIGWRSDGYMHVITGLLSPMGVSCDSDSRHVFFGTMLGVKVLTATGAGNRDYILTDTFGDKYGPGQLGIRVTGVAWSPEDPLGDVVFAASESRHVVVKFARDSEGPRTKALNNVTVKRGKTTKLRFRTEDNIDTGTLEIKIVIKKGARVVKTLKVGGRANDRVLTHAYRCTLTKGTYRWCVWGEDDAGNKQSSAKAKKLTVK